MNQEVENKLEQIKIENFIWIIYIGIIFLSWYSNYFEKNYYLYNDKISKEKYRKLLIIIFSILLGVYLYFLNSSYNDIKNLKPSDSTKKQNITKLSFIGSLLIAVSGVIFLYIAITDTDLDVEIAFN